jgi:hypothetical protein
MMSQFTLAAGGGAVALALGEGDGHGVGDAVAEADGDADGPGSGEAAGEPVGLSSAGAVADAVAVGSAQGSAGLLDELRRVLACGTSTKTKPAATTMASTAISPGNARLCRSLWLR